MGAKRFSVGLGAGPGRLGWALLVAVLGVVAMTTSASATRAVATSTSSASGALVAADAPAPPASAAANAKHKKKNKHIKYKSVKTLGELPWREIEFDAAAPSKRSGHTVNAVGKKLYVFGGCYLDEVCYNDMRVFDTVADTWTDIGKLAKDNSDSISAVPSVRGRHTATPIKTADGTKLIIFGGSANELYRNDVYIFDVKQHAWARPLITGDLPVPRAGHAAAVWHGRLYVAGGYTPNGYTNDLAVLDTTIMSWSSPPVTGSAPSPRAGHSFTRIAIAQNMPTSARAHGPPALPGPVGLDAEKAKADADKNKKKGKKKDAKKKKEKVRMSERLVLFGGANDRGVLNDLYIFDAVLGTWSRPAITGLPPTPRHDHVAAAHSHYLWFNGGCDIRALTCYNDTIVLDTDSMTWQNPMYPVTLKLPYAENVADADGLLASIKASSDAAVKKDDARKAAKAGGKKKKKSGGLWSKLKSSVGMNFHEIEDDQDLELYNSEQLTSATSSAQARFVQKPIDASGAAALQQHHDSDEQDEEDAEEEEFDEHDEPLSAASSIAAVELASKARAADGVTSASTAGAATATASATGKGDQQKKQQSGQKRRKRKRHDPKRKVKNHVEEDPIKRLSPRGGHAGAFIHKQNALYVIGGCYLEQGCSFNLLYLHIPKKLKPITRSRPDANEAIVTNVEPHPHPRASTSTIASRREKAERDRASKVLHDKLKRDGKLKPTKPTEKKIETAHVGLALLEEEEDATPQAQAQPQATATAGDDEEFETIEIEIPDTDADAADAENGSATEELDAEDAEDAAFLQETAQMESQDSTQLRGKQAIQSKFKLLHNAKAKAIAHAKAMLAAKAQAQARSRSRSSSRSGNGVSNSHANSDTASDGESESDELEVDITAEARARVHTQLMEDKRTRILEAVRAFHAAHPQRGERDLSAVEREARDSAETEATINADLHGGIGMYSDGQLQIGANYTADSKLKSLTENKLFLPLTITIGLLVIGCLALVFVWLWMRDRELDAEHAAQKAASDAAAASAAAAAAAAAGLDPRLAAELQHDEGARLALEKDLAAAKARAAAGSTSAAPGERAPLLTGGSGGDSAQPAVSVTVTAPRP